MSESQSATECLWDSLTQFGYAGCNTVDLSVRRDLVVTERVKQEKSRKVAASDSDSDYGSEEISWRRCKSLIVAEMRTNYRELSELERRFSDSLVSVNKHVMLDADSDPLIGANTLYLALKAFYDNSQMLFANTCQMPAHMSVTMKSDSKSKKSSSTDSFEEGTEQSTDTGAIDGKSQKRVSTTVALQKTFTFDYSKYSDSDNDDDSDAVAKEALAQLKADATDAFDTGVIGGVDGRKLETRREKRRKERKKKKKDIGDLHLKSILETDVFLGATLQHSEWIALRDNLHFILKRIDSEQLFGYQSQKEMAAERKHCYGYDGSVLYRKPTSVYKLSSHRLFAVEHLIEPVSLPTASKVMIEEEKIAFEEKAASERSSVAVISAESSSGIGTVGEFDTAKKDASFHVSNDTLLTAASSPSPSDLLADGSSADAASDKVPTVVVPTSKKTKKESTTAGSSPLSASEKATRKMEKRKRQKAKKKAAKEKEKELAAASEKVSGTQLSEDCGEFSRAWLKQRVSFLMECDPSALGTNVDDACDNVLQYLHNKNMSNEELQSLLLDQLGFNGFDLIGTLIQNRDLVQMKTRAFMALITGQSPQGKSGKRGGFGKKGKKGKRGKRHTTVVSLSSESHKQTAADKAKGSCEARIKKQRKEFAKMKAALVAQGFSQKDASHMLVTNTHGVGREMAGSKAAKALRTGDSEEMAEGIMQELARDKRQRHKLPTGQWYDEVVFPAPVASKSAVEARAGARMDLTTTSAMPNWAKTAFLPFGFKTLNPMQTECFEKAFETSNNLLLCAPTGAGKTNVAIMAILREIGANKKGGVLAKADTFKVIYVAPMKALAQEIVRKFSKRLAALGVVCKELTGDMRLTRAEISETHVVVVTPEKWDVITRKSSENSGGTGDGGDGLVDAVKLLIIDEVHLLHDGRGCVLEAIVARTLRFVNQKQSVIRIVGLSATLPNYLDVASFLRAENGILFFGDEYRPVPLETKFIGLSESGGVRAQKNLEDLVCFRKCVEALSVGERGIDSDAKKQVMVFVHSRMGTQKTCEILKSYAAKEGCMHLFESQSSELSSLLRRKGTGAKMNSDLMGVVPYGFGFHHAGMQRHERAFVEKLFERGLIRCLCCTATLAWGINLPASTVIIKGTQVYIAEKGGFVDLGALDVFQIFGRAGRPQYVEDFGTAILLTPVGKLPKYVALLSNQLPIESNFRNEMANHLNAEIVLGSVTTMDEAIQWLTYTYLYVRMLKNPMHYGMSYEEVIKDPHLYLRRKQILEDAALVLAKHRMCRFDAAENFFPTDVGRVAAHYYVDYKTIGFWNEILTKGSVVTVSRKHEQDVTHFGGDAGRDLLTRTGAITLSTDYLLWMLCNAEEFKELRVRDDEISHLKRLANDRNCVPYKVRAKFDEPIGKSIVLLQTWLSREASWSIKQNTLRHDVHYIEQNAGRISRALFEMALRCGLGSLCRRMLQMCKCIEQQLWMHLTPLRQFNVLYDDLATKLEATKLTLDDLAGNSLGRAYSVSDIGVLIRDRGKAKLLCKLAETIPKVFVEALCRPITRSLLSVEIQLSPGFNWVWNQHSERQTYWLWVCSDEYDDELRPAASGKHIYHFERWTLSKKEYGEFCKTEEPLKVSVVVPIPEVNQETGHRPIQQYEIHVDNNFWMGAHDMAVVDFEHLILPEMYPPETELLDLHPLSTAAVRNTEFQSVFGFPYFNAIQTQVFHVAFNTDSNMLLGAPTGSGKTVVAELCMLRLFDANAKQSQKEAMVELMEADQSATESKVGSEMDKMSTAAVLNDDALIAATVDDGVSEVSGAPILSTTATKRKRSKRKFAKRTQMRGGRKGKDSFASSKYGGGRRKVIYVAPMKALARERYRVWSKGFCLKLGLSVVMLTGDMTPDRMAIEAADIIITTPEKYDGVSRYWNTRKYVRKVGLIIFDEIHLLGLDRGPILEVIVSRLRFVEAQAFKREAEKRRKKRRLLRGRKEKVPFETANGSDEDSDGDDWQSKDNSRRVRILGLSTAIANSEDLGDWLGISRLGLYNFPAAQRPVPCTVHLAGFPGRHYCPRMQAMNKPTFQAIMSHSPMKPVLVFVSSRRQTRLTAIDLISFMARWAAAGNCGVHPWLHCDPSEVHYITSTQVKDENLKHTLEFGIGLHHAGLHPSDRRLCEELFLKGVIQVLVATSTLAWGVNLPAHLVVVKGTEYFDAKQSRYVQLPVTDILQMIGRAGRPQFDTHATAVVLVHNSQKGFYKKFLYQPFPVESSLHKCLVDHINAEVAVGTLQSTADCLQYMSYTFLFRRLLKNPSYYQLADDSAAEIANYLKDLLKGALWDLQDSGCIEFTDEKQEVFESTKAGEIASYYYLSHKTVALFRSELNEHIFHHCVFSGSQKLLNEAVSMNALLRILASATEFEELPVRHNEEKLNEALSREVPWPVSDLVMDEPSTKANILFQCHFSRIELPISDYVTDTRSVLDQSIRVLQALCDFCAHFLTAHNAAAAETVRRCVHLMQCVTQGRFLDDHSLANVPFFTEEVICHFHHAAVESLPELLHLDWPRVCQLLDSAPREFAPKQLAEIKQVLGFSLPRIGFQCKALSHSSDGDANGVTLLCKTRRFSGNPQKIYSPHWYKAKMEGWFVVVSLQSSGRLLAVKRMRVLSKNRWNTTKVQVTIPKEVIVELAEDCERHSDEVSVALEIDFLSDAYLGLDQCVTAVATVKRPVVETRDLLCEEMTEMSFVSRGTDAKFLAQHFGDDFDLESAAKVAEANIWD